MPLSRRRFLQSALAGAGAAALANPAARAASDYINITRPSSLLLGGPKPKTNINHVVVTMMENRSVDHYLGWWGERPDTDFDAGTTLKGRKTFDFGAKGEANYTGHPYKDPNHSHDGGRYQLVSHDHDRVPDGWSTTEDGNDRPHSGTDRYASSFYRGGDLPVISQILRDFTTFDRYFCSWLGSTYPNRYYMHSAQTHGVTNNDYPPQMAADHPEWAAGFDWPTLWDYLTLAGVTWTYYYSNLPAIALFGARNLPNTRHISEYYADCAAGTLPQVAFVDPFFVAPEGLANDDHPHADIRLGQEFYSDVVTAFLQSPNWADGAMFITYDEWGGFWDHVVPPLYGKNVDPYARFSATDAKKVDYTRLDEEAPDDKPIRGDDAPPDFGLYGCRVPTFLLSPHTRAPKSGDQAGRTIHTQHDHTTILQFIADNWALPNVGQWQKGHARRPQNSMMDAFASSAFEEGNPGDPEVDVAAYAYQAPPDARTTALPIPASSVSSLWGAANWIEDQGFTVHTRFTEALPVTR